MKRFVFSLATLLVFGLAFTAHAATLTSDLRLGMKGDAQVKAMQDLLTQKGFLASGNSTGNFGPLTFAAVKAYQAANGISVTGYVGPLTRASMNKFIGTVSAPGVSSAPVASISISPVSVSNVTAMSATVTSTYTSPTGGFFTVYFEYTRDASGFMYATPSRAGQIILSGKSGTFSASLANLVAGEVYYVRAVVESEGNGKLYSDTMTFIPKETNTTAGISVTDGLPVLYQNQLDAAAGQTLLSTNDATGITKEAGVLSGKFDAMGNETNLVFQYWNGGSAISSTNSVNGGSASGTVTYVLSGLAPHTTYSYRLIGTNKFGTSYGLTKTFTTLSN